MLGETILQLIGLQAALGMEVPQRYADMISDTASSDIKWLSKDDVGGLG